MEWCNFILIRMHSGGMLLKSRSPAEMNLIFQRERKKKLRLTERNGDLMSYRFIARFQLSEWISHAAE